MPQTPRRSSLIDDVWDVCRQPSQGTAPATPAGGRSSLCPPPPPPPQVVQLNALHEKKDKEYVENTILLNSEKENYRNKLDLTQQGA